MNLLRSSTPGRSPGRLAPRDPARALLLAVTAAVTTAAGVAALGSCGPAPVMMTKPSVCGNGIKETGEDCDLGDPAKGGYNGLPGYTCSKTCKNVALDHPTVKVSWGLLEHTIVNAYQGTNCMAVGADGAHVILRGPSNVDLDVRCADYQKVISGICITTPGGQPDCSTPLQNGLYTATVTLTRGTDATAVTRSVSSAAKMVEFGQTIDLPIDFEPEDFTQGYKGSLNLNTSWGFDSLNCTASDPPVATQAMILQPNDGVPPVSTKTIPGTPLDGSKSVTCFIPTANRAVEEAEQLDWGPYRLRVKGYAAGGSEPAYCGVFDVFVGPGRNTLPFNITVPRAQVTDAGVACP